MKSVPSSFNPSRACRAAGVSLLAATLLSAPAWGQSEQGASSGAASSAAQPSPPNEIFVVAPRRERFRAEAAAAATIIDVPLRELPLNIAVIPRGLRF